MSLVNLHIHHVSRVSVESEMESDMALQRVIIHYTDDDGHGAEVRLTLYGIRALQGVFDIPYTFSKREEMQ